MKKPCSFLLSFLFFFLAFLFFSSNLIFAQHSTCGSGLPWVYCGERTCADLVSVVKQYCCPSCDSPDFCKDVPECPGYSSYCDTVADCSAPDCTGAYCAVMECINHQCISDCVPCEDDGVLTPTPTPTPVTPCNGITYMLSPSPPVLENTTVTVNISRVGATPCFGNWNWVGLLLDGAPQGLGLCYADGTNCAQGYHSYINSDGVGTHTLQFTVNSGSCLCNPYSFNTLPPPAPTAEAWFQTKDGDVHAQASISDPIPTTAPEPYCSLVGDGGYPGVISYGSGTPDFGDGSASANGWLANSSYGGITYGFAYFKSLLGLTDADFTPAPPGGIGELTQDVTAYQGDLKTGNNWSIGNNKRVLIIDGKFLIKHNIRVGSNGSLVVIAKNGIGTWQNLVTVGFPSQNRLQGVFVTDGKFYTSVEDGFNFEVVAESNKKLVINGAVLAWGGTDFSRRDFSLLGGSPDYSNSDTPVESYFYDPALIINSLPSLWKPTFTWQELAP